MAMGYHPELALGARRHRRRPRRAGGGHRDRRLRARQLAPRSALQLGIGALLLIFGLQWLRKAILRSSGRKAVHDEDAIFREEAEAAARGGPGHGGPRLFAFLVSFKGVFLEGMEVVFIVITFGLNARQHPAAAGSAPPPRWSSSSPPAHRGEAPALDDHENLLKYGVGLLLASFGTFWAVEGIGIFRAGQESLSWPGNSWPSSACSPAGSCSAGCSSGRARRRVGPRRAASPRRPR